MLRPSGGDFWDREEAATLIPQCKGCSISIYGGSAWMLVYRCRVTPGNRSRTCSWGGGTEKTHRDALVEVLHWAWSVHAECVEEFCPFDIESL